MNGKVTHAVFNGERICETAQLYQYDYGQVLVFDDITLPETYEVLFSNNVMENAKTVIGNSEGAAIPDEFLITGKNVLAWIFLHDGENDGETEYVVKIPVRSRSKLSDSEITEEEHSIVSDLIAVVDTLEERIADMEEVINSYEERIVLLENRMPALGGWKTQEVTSDDSP